MICLNILGFTWDRGLLLPVHFIVFCSLVASMYRQESLIPLGLYNVDGGSSQIPVPV